MSTPASPIKVTFSGFNGVAFFWRCHCFMPRSSKFSREIHRWNSLLLSSCVTSQRRTSCSLLETMQIKYSILTFNCLKVKGTYEDIWLTSCKSAERLGTLFSNLSKKGTCMLLYCTHLDEMYKVLKLTKHLTQFLHRSLHGSEFLMLGTSYDKLDILNQPPDEKQN